MCNRLEVQERKNSVSKELEDYKVDNQRFMQDMNNKITTGKAEHIELSNEVSVGCISLLVGMNRMFVNFINSGEVLASQAKQKAVITHKRLNGRSR